MVTEVIPSKVWEHKATGRRVSLHGAVPYYTVDEKEQWHIITIGWTWRNDNGTIGLGCVPAKTREEAEEKMCRVNALCAKVSRGMCR